MNALRPRCSDIKNGTAGITCDPVSPFKKPVLIPETGANRPSKPSRRRRSGFRNENPHHINRTTPNTILARSPSIADRTHSPRINPGMVASSIGQNRKIVDLNCPTWRMTTRLEHIDGIKTNDRASFNPIAKTKMGRQVVENPKPVTPLAVAAKR